MSRYIMWLIKRYKSQYFVDITFRKLINMMTGFFQFAMKNEEIRAYPISVKIDISPLCNLRYTFCVHANPNENKLLEQQKFRKTDRMTLDQYQHIINEIKDKVTAVSLFYLGDPLMHPEVDEICRIAKHAGLNTHISTNFSFHLTDDRIRRLVRSGLTHLTVCVDGLSQEKYQLTRVGGRLDWVLSNLRRVCLFKREHDQTFPNIEVQYLKFQHNLDEYEKAKRLFQEIGVDKVTAFWGDLANYTDFEPNSHNVYAPKKRNLIPRCLFPYFYMVIKYNGDVIPCCFHRLGTQYTINGTDITLGNIFKTNIHTIWNSPKYRELRRLVSNPELITSTTSPDELFCYGCSQIFQTNCNSRSGEVYKYDDLYRLSDKGTPFRIAGS